MSKKTPVNQSPKPAAGKKQTAKKKDETYATEQMMDYYNR